MHNLINRRRTSRINELINALADKVPQLHEPNPTPLPGTKDGRSKAAVLQGARLTRQPGDEVVLRVRRGKDERRVRLRVPPRR